jgi:hypothetical protein
MTEKLLVLVKKESDGLRDLVTSEKYSRKRNLSLLTIHMTLGFEVETSQTIESSKNKMTNNEEELKEKLEIPQMEVDIDKALMISLEE